jgi:PAS domain S-box-containing protein
MEEDSSRPGLAEAINTALQARGEELEQFFELSSDLLCVGNSVCLKRVNPAFERTLGYSSQELLSQPFLDFIHPEDRDRTRKAAQEFAHGHAVRQFENRCVRRDGSEVWLEWNVAPDHHGLLYAAARDVTERRREQDRLREAQRMLAASHRELRVLADQQAALRRVATLVARGVDPCEVFSAVAEELARCLGVYHHAVLFRYEPDGAGVLLAAGHGDPESKKIPVGERFSLEGQNVAGTVFRTGRPARMVSYQDAAGSIAARFRGLGLRTAVGAPIIVESHLWGTAIVGSTQPDVTLPADTEARVADFTDLVATAIGNAQTRAELTASRARIVAAADDARRRIERDLHDGSQQRLVSLGLDLSTVQASIPSGLQPLREQIAGIVSDLAGISDELQEISRGIHPAILSRGGLGPALKALARRSCLRVQLELAVGRQMPGSAEVAAYYVVAEALTNVTKHARASEVKVCVKADGANLHLCVEDDGIGGADAANGSGLVGLVDRVEALGGHMEISSHIGCGTSLTAKIPFERRLASRPLSER